MYLNIWLNILIEILKFLYVRNKHKDMKHYLDQKAIVNGCVMTDRLNIKFWFENEVIEASGLFFFFAFLVNEQIFPG